MSHPAIIKAIKKYAKAYAELQYWQENHNAIPKGDQKTGSIGEYYAYQYLSKFCPKAKLEYGGHSEKGWDINIIKNGSSNRIQVKTVSEYSTTRTISTIHKGWDELYLIYLDKKLYPKGFWKIQDTLIFGDKDKLEGKKCPIPDHPRTGSKDIDFGQNIVNRLIVALDSYL